MIIPNIWENKKCSKPPTRHCLTTHHCMFHHASPHRRAGTRPPHFADPPPWHLLTTPAWLAVFPGKSMEKGGTTWWFPAICGSKHSEDGSRSMILLKNMETLEDSKKFGLEPAETGDCNNTPWDLLGDLYSSRWLPIAKWNWPVHTHTGTVRCWNSDTLIMSPL